MNFLQPRGIAGFFQSIKLGSFSHNAFQSAERKVGVIAGMALRLGNANAMRVVANWTITQTGHQANVAISGLNLFFEFHGKWRDYRAKYVIFPFFVSVSWQSIQATFDNVSLKPIYDFD